MAVELILTAPWWGISLLLRYNSQVWVKAVINKSKNKGVGEMINGLGNNMLRMFFDC